MHKHLIPIAVAFQALCLIQCFIYKDWSSAVAFIAACSSFAYLCWLDRKRADDLDDIKTELTALKGQVSQFAMVLNRF